MPARNAAHTIVEAIGSVLRQTFTDFELIISDDASDDDTSAVVASQDDPRIRFVSHTTHDYIANLNAAIARAQGLYVARMDADDVMAPTRLQKQVDFLSIHPNTDVVGSWLTAFGERSYVCRTLATHEELVSTMLVYNPLCHPTVMLRQECVKAMTAKQGGLYNPQFAYAEDYKLWCDLATIGFKFANLQESLLDYRTSTTQVTRIRREAMRQSTLRIRREYFCHVREILTTGHPDYSAVIENLIRLYNAGRLQLAALLETTRLVYHQFLTHTRHI